VPAKSHKPASQDINKMCFEMIMDRVSQGIKDKQRYLRGFGRE